MHKKRKNAYKKIKTIQKMTPVLAKSGFWTFQLCSRSSHPRRMRKRQNNDKILAKT
jgi:hypothetical protein